MVRETCVRSQVESYQRLKKCYLMPPCLTFSIIRYESRVKWSNPGKRVAPSPTPRCCSYRKGRLAGHPRLRLLTTTYVYQAILVCIISIYLSISVCVISIYLSIYLSLCHIYLSSTINSGHSLNLVYFGTKAKNMEPEE